MQSLVRDLKDKIAAGQSIAVDRQRIIYKGKVLHDDKTLESYGTAHH